MKKMIFAALAAMLMLAFVGCNDITPEKEELTDVVYSADLSSVTIYLDGGVPQTSANRALVKSLAEAGHDYFEVVFYHRGNGETNPQVTRASWEIGEAAGVRNVYRTVGGISYAAAGPAANAAIPATATADENYAVLFVGSKSGKTLLGVGKVKQAYVGATPQDGVPPLAAITAIATNTTSVLFEVNALTAGLQLLGKPAAYVAPLGTDTFLTAAKDDGDDVGPYSNDTVALNEATAIATQLETASVRNGGTILDFPAYRLPIGTTLGTDVSAKYTIAPSTSDATLFLGVRLDTPTTNTVYIKIPPRFPIGGGLYRGIGTPWASDVTASFDSTILRGVSPLPAVLAPDYDFTGEIPFKINVKDTEGVCALTFELPVYAISKYIPSGVEASIIWYIRPGFGTAMYDLDNGLKNPTSTGGAILLATGNASLSFLEIITSWL